MCSPEVDLGLIVTLKHRADVISNGRDHVGKQYVYFAGDLIIFAQAVDDAAATEILQQLP